MQHPKEQVLVIPAALTLILAPSVFNRVPCNLEHIILENHSFRDREEAETNLAFKQVIPYVVVRHKDDYLLAKRLGAQQETRLHNLYSIGQGGHINDHDAKSKDVILTGLMRELREEFTLAPEYGCTPLGLINDNSTPVSQVHLGIIYELRVSTPLLRVAEEGKHTASWENKATLKTFYDRMENWSQVIMDHVLCAA